MKTRIVTIAYHQVSTILEKTLNQVCKIDRVEQMVKHLYFDMTNKATWIEFKQLQRQVAELEAEIEKLKKK